MRNRPDNTAVPFTIKHRRMVAAMCGRIKDLERRRELAMRNSREGILALIKISKIKNREWGPDWEEIEEARKIADEALATMGLSLNHAETLEIDDEQVDK